MDRIYVPCNLSIGCLYEKWNLGQKIKTKF